MKNYWILACFLVLTASGCVSSNIMSKEGRMLSIDVNTAEDGDYEKAFSTAKAAGLEVVPVSINWDMIEKQPGQYEDPGNTLATVNAYYPLKRTKVALYIRSLDTASKPVPADLKEVRFNDPLMTERYVRMIEWVFSQIQDAEIEFLSLGDEIDLMVGNNRQMYDDFSIFFKAAKERIKAKRPALKIGFSATLYGLTRNFPEQLGKINQHSDVVLVSYYPVTGNFMVRDPAVVGQEIDELAAAYPGRIIYIEQTGYPTSSLLNSSEEKQRLFVREIFRAWDKRTTQIKYVSFTWLHDLPQSGVDFLEEYYNYSDPRFLEYLRTLGLRTHAGSDKPAFETLKSETRTRGW